MAEKIPKGVADLPKGALSRLFSAAERQLLGLIDRTIENYPDDTMAYVVLKYFQPSAECFSDWTPNELKAFSSFVEKVNGRTWSMIYSGGGLSGNKLGNGLGYKPHKDQNNLPADRARIQAISEDITFFELRVSDEARVHGFRVHSAFFLVWLDRNHRFYAM